MLKFVALGGFNNLVLISTTRPPVNRHERRLAASTAGKKVKK